MMKRFGLAAAGAAVLAACAVEEPPRPAPASESQMKVRVDPARLTQTLDGFIADGRTDGTVTVVFHAGEEVFFHANGVADRLTGRPMTRQTPFQIYSMSKPVTGVALMTLYDQGKFELDDPIADYLPELSDLQVFVGMANGQMQLAPMTRPITIRDVVTHTAGFGYGWEGDHPVGALYAEDPPLDNGNSLEEMVTRLGVLPLFSQPGRSWRYSLSVDVQARLVEVLSGRSFHEYLEMTVFEPLGMDQTRRFLTQDELGALARGVVEAEDGKLYPLPVYDDNGQLSEFYAYNGAPHPLEMGGSGLVMPIDDYLRFARMLLNEGELDGARILKPHTVRLMATDMLEWPLDETGFLLGKGDVGFGVDFAVRKSPPQTPDQPAGAPGEFHWDGYPSTLFWIDPANDLAVIFLTQKLPFDGSLHSDVRNAVYHGSPFVFQGGGE